MISVLVGSQIRELVEELTELLGEVSIEGRSTFQGVWREASSHLSDISPKTLGPLKHLLEEVRSERLLLGSVVAGFVGKML